MTIRSKRTPDLKKTARGRTLAAHGFVDPGVYNVGQMQVPAMDRILQYVEPDTEVLGQARTPCWRWRLRRGVSVLDGRNQARYRIRGCEFSVVRLLLTHRYGRPFTGDATNTCLDPCCVNPDHWRTAYDAYEDRFQFSHTVYGWVLLERGSPIKRDTILVAGPISALGSPPVVLVRHVIRALLVENGTRFEVLCGLAFDPLSWAPTFGVTNCPACIR